MFDAQKLEDIKQKILSLSAKTVSAGCTEAEAEAAMRMVGKLLDQYNLSMDEVTLKQEECIQIDVNSNVRVRSSLQYAALGIAKFCTCKIWVTKSRGPNDPLKYVFFGTKSDVLMAKYLYAVILQTMIAESSRYMARNFATRQDYGTKKVARSSFESGFCNRIYVRLTQLTDERTAASATTTSNALVVVKNQLVENSFNQLNKTLNKHYGSTYRKQTNYSANNAGQAAANNVNLSRPVGVGTERNKLLG